MASEQAGPWTRELDDFVRAFAGAYIFAVPLLFTMEMWWIGEYADRWKLLSFLGIAFVANFGLSYVSGFKREETLGAIVGQAIDAVAVGVVAASAMLLVLNRFGRDDPLDSILGMIIIQAVPLSIGASVANEVFRRSRQGDEDNGHLPPWQELLADIGATMIGGVFIGFSIAPTEEVRMLASELGYGHLMAVVGFTLLLSYGIVFASGFDKPRPPGPFQSPLTETTLAYVVSILVSLTILYLFDQIEFGDPLQSVVEQAIVLAVPTTVGGAAGRLVV